MKLGAKLAWFTVAGAAVACQLLSPDVEEYSGGCGSTLRECDGDSDTRCETNVSEDPKHCGACGNDCKGAACVGGACQAVCDANIDDDPKHCGACGHDCLGGGCADGKCQPIPIASELAPAAHVGFHEEYVYWTGNFALMRKKTLAPGSASETVVDASAKVFQFAFSDTHVYFTSYANGSVGRKPLNGGAVEPIWTSAPGAHPTAIVADGDVAHWLVVPDPDPTGVPVAGQVKTSTLSGTTWDTKDLVTNAGPEPNGIALGNGRLYWTTSAMNAVLGRVATSGGAHEIVYQASGRRLGQVAFGAGELYFAARLIQGTDVGAPAGEILRLAAAASPGSKPKELVAGQADPLGLVIDSERVYWANVSVGTVMSAEHDGGALETVGSTGSSAWFVAVNDQAICWSTSEPAPNTGIVWLRAK